MFKTLVDGWGENRRSDSKMSQRGCHPLLAGDDIYVNKRQDASDLKEESNKVQREFRGRKYDGVDF